MSVRISGFTTTRPNMSGTRLYEDFMKFLGMKEISYFTQIDETSGLCPSKIL